MTVGNFNSAGGTTTAIVKSVKTIEDTLVTPIDTIMIQETSANTLQPGDVIKLNVANGFEWVGPLPSVISSWGFIGKLTGTPSISSDGRTLSITCSGTASSTEGRFCVGGPGNYAKLQVTDDSVAKHGDVIMHISCDDVTEQDATIADYEPNDSKDATLSALQVDGTSVSGFAPTTLSYDVVLATGTVTVPTVTATVTDTGKATAVVTSAAALPGATKVLVTAEDGTTTQTYTINFTVTEATMATLTRITITNPAAKLIYNVQDALDITGLVVTGTYSDSSTKAESITAENITGFDSSAAVTGQVLTITVGGKTATYLISVAARTNLTAFNISVIPNNTLRLGDDFFDMSSDAMNDPQATIMVASLLKDGINKNTAYFKFGGKWYAPFVLTEAQFLDPAYALTDAQVNAITGFNKWYKAGSEIVDLRPGTYTITPINEFSSGFGITANNVPGAVYFNIYKKSSNALVNAVPIAIGTSLNSMPAVFSSISDLEVWIYSDAAGTNKLVELKLEGSSTAGILDYK